MLPTVCTVRSTGAPAGCAEVKSTVAGWGSMKPTTAQTAKPAATTKSPMTTESLPPNDISHSLAPSSGWSGPQSPTDPTCDRTPHIPQEVVKNRSEEHTSELQSLRH